jgi:thiol:disulfide interchange protein DsbD
LSVRWLVLVLGLTACHGGAEAPVVAGAGGITWLHDHDSGLSQAREHHQPAMIDFTADWCVPCKELEKKTFPDARVAEAAKRFVSVQIDATETTPAVDKLFSTYGIESLPTIVFVDSSGAVLKEPRLNRFIEPEGFVELLGRVH